MSDWQFEIDEVGPESESDPDPIEPGSPEIEHVIPFLFGIGLAIAVLLLSF
ncbi:MAG: hypothetical protein ABEJ60_02075 [Halodesulfurarchaeum sp.]